MNGGGQCHFQGKYSIGSMIGKPYKYTKQQGQCNPAGVYVNNASNRRKCPDRIGNPYRIGNVCAPAPTKRGQKNENVFVASSLNPDAGKGLFAARDFRKNENVADLDGTIVPIENAESTHAGYLVYWSDGMVLDTLNQPNKSLGRFANSTFKDPNRRKANVRLTLDRKNKRARLKALRPIKQGQEILLNYGRGFFTV